MAPLGKINNPLMRARKAQTHCIHGHEFTERNTRIRANGTRQCRACANAETRQRQAAARAAGSFTWKATVRLKAEQKRDLARRAGLTGPGYIVTLCHYCDEPGLVVWIGAIVTFQDLEVDHVVPVSRGGANTLDNVVLACPLCNRSKGNRPVVSHLVHKHRTTG